MKWITKRIQWQRPYYQARYKKHILKVCEKTEGWDKNLLGYYFLVSDVDNVKSYNSLWNNKWYESIEEAQQACISYADEVIAWLKK